jgi:hypothetical protein
MDGGGLFERCRISISYILCYVIIIYHNSVPGLIVCLSNKCDRIKWMVCINYGCWCLMELEILFALYRYIYYFLLNIKMCKKCRFK